VQPIDFSYIGQVAIQSAVVFDEFCAHTPDFFKDGVVHGSRFLRIAWPKRNCGMDSGDTMRGATNFLALHSASNRFWMMDSRSIDKSRRHNFYGNIRKPIKVYTTGAASR
jgi:hypothetical protein